MFLSALNRRFNRLGVRPRLVLMFVAVFGVFFLAFSTGIFFYIAKTQKKAFDVSLYNYALDVSRSSDLVAIGEGQEPREMKVHSEMMLPFSLGETRLEVTDIAGQVLMHSRNLKDGTLPYTLEKFKELKDSRAVYEDIYLPAADGSPQHFRMISHRAHRPGVGDFVVQAAVPMVLLDAQRESLIRFFGITIPLMLLGAAIGAFFISRKAMAPVSEIIERTNEIEAKHLSEQLPIPESRDEIRDLAVTLNGLLRRLEKAFRSQEAFIADASHQLKTPLSILKGELDIFAKGRRTPEETEQFVVSAAQEIEYLSKMVEDLLILARMEAAGGVFDFQPLQLDEKLTDIAARIERSPLSRGVSFSIQLHTAEDNDSPFSIRGEPELLRAMIENLLDNAVKYSPEKGTVLAELADTRNSLKLRVQDNGAGISELALKRVFERFYRQESTRDSVSGTGLGLSIVQRIAHLHGGRVKAGNQPGAGAAFEVVFPKN
ncbi:HAMP domain-containing histidine kinase [bacterium]|nr:HAMP domain-containing histidine kinase [bacterium]